MRVTWLRFHLSTLLLLCIAAGLFLGANLFPQRGEQRSYIKDYEMEGGVLDPVIDTYQVRHRGWPVNYVRELPAEIIFIPKKPGGKGINLLPLEIPGKEVVDWSFAIPLNAATGVALLFLIGFFCEKLFGKI